MGTGSVPHLPSTCPMCSSWKNYFNIMQSASLDTLNPSLSVIIRLPDHIATKKKKNLPVPVSFLAADECCSLHSEPAQQGDYRRYGALTMNSVTWKRISHMHTLCKIAFLCVIKHSCLLRSPVYQYNTPRESCADLYHMAYSIIMHTCIILLFRIIRIVLFQPRLASA